MIFIAVLKNKRQRAESERRVIAVLEFIQSKKWDWKSLPGKALKHIEKNNLKIHDPVYYKKSIQSWKQLKTLNNN